MKEKGQPELGFWLKVESRTKERPSDSEQISQQKPYKLEGSRGQYSTSLKNFKPRISYPAKLSFISEGEIKSFTDKQLLRDFIAMRPALQELLKEVLNMERNN